jgi:hypothetical protein
MQEKYIVRLTDQERSELLAVAKNLKGTSQKVQRAQILLKADAVARYVKGTALRTKLMRRAEEWRWARLDRGLDRLAPQRELC